jgi:hypothetical protein
MKSYYGTVNARRTLNEYCRLEEKSVGGSLPLGPADETVEPVND